MIQSDTSSTAAKHPILCENPTCLKYQESHIICFSLCILHQLCTMLVYCIWEQSWYVEATVAFGRIYLFYWFIYLDLYIYKLNWFCLGKLGLFVYTVLALLCIHRRYPVLLHYYVWKLSKYPMTMTEESEGHIWKQWDSEGLSYCTVQSTVRKIVEY